MVTFKLLNGELEPKVSEVEWVKSLAVVPEPIGTLVQVLATLLIQLLFLGKQ